MKTIPLTQDKVVMVDDDDYEYLMQWKWYAQKCREGIYYAQFIMHDEVPFCRMVE